MANILSYASSVLQKSPILYWRMQETSGTTVTDSSGNGRNGTQSGIALGATDTRFNSDKPHYIYNVGTADSVSIADAAWMDITGAFTIAVWIRVSTLTTNSRNLFGNVVAVNGSADPPSTNRYGLAIYNNQIYGLVSDGTTVSSIVSPTTINSVTTDYHFIVFTRSGSALKLYRDGRLWKTETGTANNLSTSSTDGLRICAHDGGVNTNNIGLMTELMLFDSALSGTDIAALYEAAAGVTGTVALIGQPIAVTGYNRLYLDTILTRSPSVALSLQEMTGTTAADFSGTSRNASISDGLVTNASGPFQVQPNRCYYNASGDNLRAVVADATWMDSLTQNATLEIWAKAVSGQSGGRHVWGFSNSADGTWKLSICWSSGKFQCRAYYGDSSSDTLETVGTYEDSAWHHVVAVREYGVGLKIYIDGALENSAAVSTAKTLGISTSSGLVVFAPTSQTTYSFVGYVAWAALYPSALSPAQIGGHYVAAMGAALAGTPYARATATGDLSAQAGVLALDGSAAAQAAGAGSISVAQALVAEALARVAAEGRIPTPGPGFGGLRVFRPFARYGNVAVSWWDRPYADESGALAGDAAARATAQGDLKLTVIGLSGDAVVRVAVTGNLGSEVIVAEQLSGSANVRIAATGDLQTDSIQGAAPVVMTGTGAAGVATPLSAEAVARAIAAGTPSVLVPLGGAAPVVEAATGALLAATGLAGSATDATTASAAMVAAMAASGSAASRAAAVASLMVGSALAGQAAAVGTVQGTLGVGMDLDADAQARSTATGTTGVSTDLSGQARASSEAAGTLRDLATVTGGIAYAVNLASGAVTNLLGFEFERLATAHGGTLYGLKAGTLYVVGGDADPGPAAIQATIRFAPHHYGTIGQKRLETVYLYTRELTGLTVTPIYDEILGMAYATIPLNRDGMRASRAHVGRGNHWHTLGLTVANTDGGKLDVGGIEPIVSKLSRKRR